VGVGKVRNQLPRGKLILHLFCHCLQILFALYLLCDYNQHSITHKVRIMELYKRLEEATEAANRLLPIVGIWSGKEMEYFAKDLATVIIFLDTTLPLFLSELIALAKEAEK